MIGKLSCLLIMLTPSILCSQILPTEELLTDNSELETDNRDIDAIAEHLKFRKVNINLAEAEELITLPGISRKMAFEIIAHKQTYGYFHNAYELQQINGIDSMAILRMLPYINFRLPGSQNLKSLSKVVHSELLLQAQSKSVKSMGFINKEFMGSPIKDNLRFKINFNNAVLFQFNVKKDAGENYRYSGIGYSIYYKGHGKFQELIIGNFQVQFGQGLCIGKGLALGKSSNVMGTMRANNGIRPSGSVNSADYLKGLGMHIQPKRNIHIWAIFSSRKTDARFQTDSNFEKWYLSDLSNGYYRTQKDLQYRKTILQNNVLIRSEWRTGHLKLNCTYSASKKQGIKEVLLNAKDRKTLYKIGFDCQYTIQNMVLFNETCKDVSGNQWAFIQGALISLDKTTDVSIIYRQYTANFNSDNSNALSAGNGSNENAWLIGYQFKPNKKLQVNTYFDLFKHPYNTFKADGPNNGKDALILFNYTEKNILGLQIKYRIQSTQYNSDKPGQMSELESEQKQNFRIELNYKTGKHSDVKHRFEMVSINRNNQSATKGYLMYHQWSTQLNKIKFNLRFTIFNTDDFNSRVYAYENDLSGVYTMKAWQDRGYAAQCLVQYHVNKIVQIKTKFAGIRYSDYHVSGSGPDQCSAFNFGELKFELHIKI